MIVGPNEGGLSALLTPAEAARLIGVNTKTLGRWAHEGELTAVVTPGGHRRYLDKQVMALADEDDLPPADAPLVMSAATPRPGPSELELIAAWLLNLQTAWDDVNAPIAPAALELIVKDLRRWGPSFSSMTTRAVTEATRRRIRCRGATAYLI